MYSICVLQKQTTTLNAALLSAERFQTKSYLSLKLASRILQCRALTPLYLGNDTTSLLGNTSTPTQPTHWGTDTWKQAVKQPTMRHQHLRQRETGKNWEKKAFPGLQEMNEGKMRLGDWHEEGSQTESKVESWYANQLQERSPLTFWHIRNGRTLKLHQTNSSVPLFSLYPSVYNTLNIVFCICFQRTRLPSCFHLTQQHYHFTSYLHTHRPQRTTEMKIKILQGQTPMQVLKSSLCPGACTPGAHTHTPKAPTHVPQGLTHVPQRGRSRSLSPGPSSCLSPLALPRRLRSPGSAPARRHRGCLQATQRNRGLFRETHSLGSLAHTQLFHIYPFRDTKNME